MIQQRQILFPPFRLDPINELLLRDQEVIPLRHKSFAVLRYLAERPHKLVRKEELIEAIWPETFVTDTLLKGCVTEIRKALGDDPASPRFIETAHRRGYRFIGSITEESAPQQNKTSGRFLAPLRLRLSAPPCLVGRETCFMRLERSLERAMDGERQIVFITGEAGIGKTAVVDSFLLRAARDPEVWLAHGRCLGQYGAGEAYLPVLEAFSRLCQELGRERLFELLRRRAPSWLRQMPGLVSAAELEEFEGEAIGVTRERMLREMAETRLKGEMLLVSGLRIADRGLKEADAPSNLQSRRPNPQSAIHNPQSEAEDCFIQAIEIARRLFGEGQTDHRTVFLRRTGDR